MGQDATLSIENVACVALTALHTVVVAVTLQANGSTAGLTDTHTTLIMAVGRAGDSCNRRHKSRLFNHKQFFPETLFTHLGRWRLCFGGGGEESFITFPDHCPSVYGVSDLSLLK